MEHPDRLPLFPLKAVLYPGILLPLRIFERRYRQLIGECLDRNRLFGVCLIRAGEEVGEPAEPFEVGTTAEILEVMREPDGQAYLLAVGRRRFRIREVTQQRPYLTAAVEVLPEVEGADVPPERLASFQQQLERYLRLLSASGGRRLAPLSLPADAAQLAYLACAVLQLPAADKQSLLEAPSAADRLARADAHLEQLAAEMEAAGVSPEPDDDAPAVPFDALAALRRTSPN